MRTVDPAPSLFHSTPPNIPTKHKDAWNKDARSGGAVRAWNFTMHNVHPSSGPVKMETELLMAD